MNFDTIEKSLNFGAQLAFENIDMNGLEVADKLRNVSWHHSFQHTPSTHEGEGSFFGQIDGEEESQKYSFHCHFKRVNEVLESVCAYVYNCNTGNEVAHLNGRELCH